MRTMTVRASVLLGALTLAGTAFGQSTTPPLATFVNNSANGATSLQQATGLAEIDHRTRTVRWTLPECPFDAGVITAEHRIGERRQRQHNEAGHNQAARHVPGGGNRQQHRQRDREIIGIALFEAERAWPDIQYQLEEPGPRQGRRGDG